MVSLEDRLLKMNADKRQCMGCGGKPLIIVDGKIVCRACGFPAPRVDGTCIDLIDPADAFKRLLESDYLQGLGPDQRAVIADRSQGFVNQIRDLTTPSKGYGQLTVKTLGAGGFEVWSLCPCGCGHSTQVGSYPLDSRGIYEIVRVTFGQKALDTLVFDSSACASDTGSILELD